MPRLHRNVGKILGKFSLRLGAVFFACLLFLVLPVLAPPAWGAEIARATSTLVLLSLAALLDSILRIALWHGLVAQGGRRPIPALLPELGSTILFVAAVSLILNRLYDVSLAGILAASGLVGIAAGFALRGLLADIFSGIALNLDRSIALGDWVDIPHRGAVFQGEIVEMNWRTVHLGDRDANLIIIPNSEFAGAIIKNRSRPSGGSRYSISFGLDQEIPIERVRRIFATGLYQAARHDAILSEPAPSVMLTGTQGNLILYGLYYYINPARHSPTQAQHAVHEHALSALSDAGLRLGIPKTDHGLIHHPPPAPDPGDRRSTALAKAPLFAPLTPDERRELSRHCTMITIQAHHTLLHQGEPGTSMFILLEGALDVLVARSDGGQTPVGFLIPGDGVGEMSLMTGMPRTASVRAATDCLLLEIDQSAITPILQRNPALIDALSHLLADHQNATLLALSEQNTPDMDETGDHRLVTQIARHIRRLLGQGP